MQLGQQFDQFQLFVVAVQNVIKASAGMTEQTALDNVLLGEGVKQMQEISREEILRQIFGDIGELADDFTCAVESTVLLHGRMYITNRFICFYSNLFGLEKKIRIPYSHIRSITKENTAMVIPNAIAISTDKKDYTFRSFWDREDCFRILTAFLSKFRGVDVELPPPRPRGQDGMRKSTMSASSHGHDTGLASIPESESGSNDDAIAKHQSLPVSSSRKANLAAPLPSPPPAPLKGASPAKTTPGRPEEAMDTEFETDNLTNADKAASGGDQKTLFAEEVLKATQKLAVVTGEILNISMKDFADLVVEEGAPFSYKWYHESVKDNSLVVTPWTEMPSQLGFGREIKFFKPVNLPGLASTRGVKLQKYRKFDDVGLILCSSTRLEDVPCADSFSVEDTLVVRKVDETHISVDISFCVLFLKSTMMKYIIERSTNGEMAKWLEVFFKHLKKITDLKKEGKLVLPTEGDSAAAPAATPPAPASPKDAAAGGLTNSLSSSSSGTQENPVVTSKKAGAKGGVSEGFMAMLSFREESLGDQIKFALSMVLALYLVINFIRWQLISRKLDNLEASVRKLEALAQELLEAKRKSLF